MENNEFSIDVVSDFEKLFGKRHEEWTRSEQLLFLKQAIMNNQVKQSYLKSIGDTYFGISWNDFLEVCQKIGFEVDFKQDFLSDAFGEKQIDEEICLIHREKGLILYASSVDSKARINKAQLYGEIRKKDGVTFEAEYEALSEASFSGTQYGTKLISIDVRECMLTKLSQLNEVCEFVNPWNEMPFVWFLTYTEEKALENGGMGYDEINKQKIALMSPTAREIMGVPSVKKI